MKIIIMLLLVFLSAGAIRAQTFDEWLRQKKTQKKYLLEQIASLKVYGGYLKKGYDISKKGLNTISAIKNGDFGLHSDFFNSLKTVNPEVGRYSRGRDILEQQELIAKKIDRIKREYNQSGIFSSLEKKYFDRVFQKLETDCKQTIEKLDQVVRSGELEMKDSERIERIDVLYTESTGQLDFANAFSNSIILLAVQRSNEKNDLDNIRTWYGIKGN